MGLTLSLPAFGWDRALATAIRRFIQFRGSSLPSRDSSAISATFIARLIKGCRGDVHAGLSHRRKPKHFQRSNEHFSRESAASGGCFHGNRRAKCPS
jgi:hypothetical protein